MLLARSLLLQVLSFLVSGVKTPDPTTLANVATALCRCTYEARNHKRLVTEFNTAQALCYIMQRQTASLKVSVPPHVFYELQLCAKRSHAMFFVCSFSRRTCNPLALWAARDLKC